MAIYERITEGGNEGSEYESLAVHYLSAALGQYCEGKWTLEHMASALRLTADDQREVAAIKKRYDRLERVEQIAYLWELERVFCLTEAGLWGKSKVDDDLHLRAAVEPIR